MATRRETPKMDANSIFDLSPSEKLQLAGYLWDDLTVDVRLASPRLAD